jgi:hypothetical protein
VWKAIKADCTWEEHVVDEVVNYTSYEHLAIKFFTRLQQINPKRNLFCISF